MFNRNEINGADTKATRAGYHWSEMEEYHPDGGMWAIPKALDRARFMDASAELMRRPDDFYKAMLVALRRWPRSCEVAFTTPGLNKRAWIGHAGCYLATGSVEDCTRLGWHQLTPDQQRAANQAADDAIAHWRKTQTATNDEGLW